MGFQKEYLRTHPKEYAPLRLQTWTAPDAADTFGILRSQSVDSASTATVTSGFGTLDFARDVVVTPAGTTADVKTSSITIAGTDIRGESISENVSITANQTTSVTTNAAFASITSITIPPQDGDSALYHFGLGAGLGLDRKLEVDSVIKAVVDGSHESTRPTVTVSATTMSLNKATTNTAPNGSKDIEMLYYYNIKDQ